MLNGASLAMALDAWSIATSAEFAFGSGGTCAASLAAASSCTKVVTFSPTSAGSKSATLSVTAGASVTLTGATPLTAVYRINCGSSTAASPFTADQYASGGTQHSVTNAINLSGVTNAAPQAVYQSERYGNVTYTFPSLTASGQYTVRLHFAELYQTAAGRRVFNVAINGTSVLSNFDIYAAAGGNYKAVVREFTRTANTSGQMVVALTTVTDNASISGIEITGACVPGATQCNGNLPQTCSASGTWVSGTACPYVCVSGACTGVCVPGASQRSGNSVQTCNASGVWSSTACPYVCVSGACTGVCVPGAKNCSGNIPQTCSAMGTWQNGTACPIACVAGVCSS